MVWSSSSPPRAQPPNSQPPASHLISPSRTSIGPLQRHSEATPRNGNVDRPSQTKGPPSTAGSFSTSSSDLIFAPEPPSRSPSRPSDHSRYIPRSQNSVPHMLPSPPEESLGYSQDTSRDYISRTESASRCSSQGDFSDTIPSAQPSSYAVPVSPQTFSIDSAAASLPSPPPSQERSLSGESAPLTSRRGYFRKHPTQDTASSAQSLGTHPDEDEDLASETARRSQPPRDLYRGSAQSSRGLRSPERYSSCEVVPPTPGRSQQFQSFAEPGPSTRRHENNGKTPEHGFTPSTPRRPAQAKHSARAPASPPHEAHIPGQYPSDDVPSPTTSKRSPHTVRTRHVARNHHPSATSDSADDLQLMDSVLDGIGRMHVAMGKDDAGRWRIMRTDDERP